MKEYRQVPPAIEAVEDRMPEWGPACKLRAMALCDPQLSNPAKMRKKCCYGQEKNLGQYRNLSLSPLISHTQQNVNAFENKVWELYIFVKKCVRSFIEVFIIVDYVSVYMYTRSIQHFVTRPHTYHFIVIFIYFLQWRVTCAHSVTDFLLQLGGQLVENYVADEHFSKRILLKESNLYEVFNSEKSTLTSAKYCFTVTKLWLWPVWIYLFI